MKNLLAFAFGALFALGLLISGMSNPAKVLSFLDLFGNWDISLAFVILGAIVVAFLPFQRAIRHPKTWLGEKIDLPSNQQIDKKLISGAILFGVGGDRRCMSCTCIDIDWAWALSGFVFCGCHVDWHVYSS